MFQVNDTVVYGSDGICVIEEIAARTFDRKTQEYYVLRPLYGNQSTIFVPTQNEKLCAKMRRLLSAEEIHAIIRGLPGAETVWIDNEALRKQTYAQILRSGDRKDILRLLKTLHLHQQKLRDSGRKFHASDERFMKEAERVLYGEFAHVLHLEPAQVEPMILREIHRVESGS